MMAIPIYRHCLFLIGYLSFCVDSFARGQKNNTLIFTKENTIRNCTCPESINDKDCDYNLANLICNCRTVLPYMIDKTYYSNLTVWFTEPSMLGMLLNFTAVYDLKLSHCGIIPLSTKHLVIWGLRRLQIRTEVNGQFQEQSLTIYSRCDSGTQSQFKMSCRDTEKSIHVAVLDTSLFNGYAPLKSYSMENLSNFTGHFPHLPYLDTFFTNYNSSCLITFIY